VKIDLKIFPNFSASVRQLSPENRGAKFSLRIILRVHHQDTDATGRPQFLRSGDIRIGRCNAYERSDELAPFHVAPDAPIANRSNSRAQSKEAKGGSEQNAVQQATRYSITSSARASSVGGTVMPSALAVRKLIENSNFDG
jgi:hypothetical protein